MPNASNTISIHCHQTQGGQYIDAGISFRSYEKKMAPLGILSSTVQNFGKNILNQASNKLSVAKKKLKKK